MQPDKAQLDPLDRRDYRLLAADLERGGDTLPAFADRQRRRA